MLFIPLVRIPGSPPWWTCSSCKTRIAADDAVIAVKGRPARRVYENPAGEKFEIVTVAGVVDVARANNSLDEHSWFEGYSWRPVACGRCGNFLGWEYEALRPGEEPAAFFGLIIGRVVREA